MFYAPRETHLFFDSPNHVPATLSMQPKTGEEKSEWFKSPLKEKLRRLAYLTSAVEVVHTLGMVHADIKPQNILIGKEG